MKGQDAARLFYDEQRFSRKGAMPKRVQKTLIGVGGVQSLDGIQHRHRKSLFVSQLMQLERIEQLARLHELHWKSAIRSWPINSNLSLYHEAQRILCQSACEWAGVPIASSEIGGRANEFGLMINSGAKIGLYHFKGRRARHACERWIKQIILDIREGKLAIAPDKPLYAIAWHQDEHKQLLPIEIAAVEVINILRPIVAISQLITFSALALHQYPACRESLQQDDDGTYQRFLLEVRRYYPFFPFLAAHVTKDFVWKGLPFKKGQRALLDIYGTNHDPRLWDHPEKFDPDRFRSWEDTAYNFIANGGGTYDQHHRCPGEFITNSLLKVAIEILMQDILYTVPPQNLHLDLTTIPSQPPSTFQIHFIGPPK